MPVAELIAEIESEFEQIRQVIHELSALYHDAEHRSPTLREKVAAAGFLSQFYNGIENILKRISKHIGVPLPQGEGWHVELFDGFCGDPSSSPFRRLPPLFDESLAIDIAKYRGFRHVARQAYGVELDWDLMREGISGAEGVFAKFEANALTYLHSLQ